MTVWVDTDFGFDDLWALLMLRAHGVGIAGVSLVAGNSTLPVVRANAVAAAAHFGFDWGFSLGAGRPLLRDLETAERILGPSGMQTAGRHLPTVPPAELPDAQDALWAWLEGPGPHDMLALGPLTNLARLYATHPEKAARIGKITWMGGARGRGNHSPYAEFNALVDPEALAQLLAARAPLRIVDLDACRQVVFGPDDVPRLADPILSDLLWGYLGIGLSRGRAGMAIYDPLAALALFAPDVIGFERAFMQVDLSAGERLGQTVLDYNSNPNVEIAKVLDPGRAVQLCLAALEDIK
jgi:inosine-uridine nucleoside N-ribohydrolase